jgi:hypothetical protein
MFLFLCDFELNLKKDLKKRKLGHEIFVGIRTPTEAKFRSFF